MNTYSTAQVAQRIGVHKMTLLKWLWANKIPEPRRRMGGGQDVRLWSDLDVERAREFKDANYRKGRGRKKTSKK